ncbi:hypothetical protein IFM89_006400 [Coptis chinensis]|uniref:Uncharacterized protein n=1 Tax=Coptis chinensis TaxID=261450 RepID=A0A835LYR8_9MAGN|nr:hypothetical protein IFM89_006400 [Coptis chinensis]
MFGFIDGVALTFMLRHSKPLMLVVSIPLVMRKTGELKDQYLPPLVERKAGRPKKQRIRDEDEERASSTRKCKLCKPGHNQRTCPERPNKQCKKRKRKSKSKSKDTGDVAENEGQAAQGQVPPQAPEGQVPTISGTKGSRGRRGGTVRSAEVSESQVSQQVNASQASEEPLNESQASARPPTRGSKGTRSFRGGQSKGRMNFPSQYIRTRGTRGGQSRGRMYSYFENPTSYTHQPTSRATNESSITGQSQKNRGKGREQVNKGENSRRGEEYPDHLMSCVRFGYNNMAREEVMVARAYVDEHGDEVSHDEVLTHVMKWRDARDATLVARGLPTAYPEEIEEK